MIGRAKRVGLDDMLRDLTMIGFGALLAWSLTGAVGCLSGYLTIQTQPALRFLLAVLVLVFARRTYWELCEWRWRKLPPDDRYGFSSPLWETPRSNESLVVQTHHADGEVTGPPHGQG